MSMMSFVGYVNSLVVESGIVCKLPEAILTQRMIIGEDAAKVELIAGVKESEKKQRERDEMDLVALENVLRCLKDYSK